MRGGAGGVGTAAQFCTRSAALMAGRRLPRVGLTRQWARASIRAAHFGPRETCERRVTWNALVTSGHSRSTLGMDSWPRCG